MSITPRSGHVNRWSSFVPSRPVAVTDVLADGAVALSQRPHVTPTRLRRVSDNCISWHCTATRPPHSELAFPCIDHIQWLEELHCLVGASRSLAVPDGLASPLDRRLAVGTLQRFLVAASCHQYSAITRDSQCCKKVRDFCGQMLLVEIRRHAVAMSCIMTQDDECQISDSLRISDLHLIRITSYSHVARLSTSSLGAVSLCVAHAPTSSTF
ncbi:hypothetical protein HD554DRAFT_2141734 [Boletus coccyginus]|nr:hypothetical protein HD554DRAFT_2141734 [Boletus coccyginus]